MNYVAKSGSSIQTLFFIPNRKSFFNSLVAGVLSFLHHHHHHDDSQPFCQSFLHRHHHHGQVRSSLPLSPLFFSLLFPPLPIKMACGAYISHRKMSLLISMLYFLSLILPFRPLSSVPHSDPPSSSPSPSSPSTSPSPTIPASSPSPSSDEFPPPSPCYNFPADVAYFIWTATGQAITLYIHCSNLNGPIYTCIQMVLMPLICLLLVFCYKSLAQVLWHSWNTYTCDLTTTTLTSLLVAFCPIVV